MSVTQRRITVDYLARVEGEGSLDVTIRDGAVADLALGIFEAPRLFEAILRGRSFRETPDITARICGICPVAYQTSAANAAEKAFGVLVTPEIRLLRHLLYLGEWIESHALHIYLLHAPDFLGYESGIAMAGDHRDLVSRGLELKRIGNEVMRTIGGREIHPVNPRVGGFHSSPETADVEDLRAPLEWALDAAVGTAEWAAGFEFPDFDQDYEFVALSSPDEYAIVDGRLRSNRGIDAPVEAWDDLFVEEQVEHSNALHATVRARGSYMTGPLARFALNHDRLHPAALDAARAIGLTAPCTNPFKSILVRAVELVHATATAIDLIDAYIPPEPPHVDVTPFEAEGHGASEAPRGICYHRYGYDAAGDVTEAQIVPPTSQNQLRIEEDLRQFIPNHLHLDDDQLTLELERAIRNYDPCISCATHFLDLRIERNLDA